MVDASTVYKHISLYRFVCNFLCSIDVTCSGWSTFISSLNHEMEKEGKEAYLRKWNKRK